MITDPKTVDRMYVGGFERGKRNPRLLVMARISVPLTKLLGGNGGKRAARAWGWGWDGPKDAIGAPHGLYLDAA